MNPWHSWMNRTAVAAAVALTVAAGGAYAHHGWSWTQDGMFRLEGVIAAIYVGNPHATLDADVDGEIWRVELAPPSRTIAAGFSQDTAKPGDEVVAIGNRSRDETERRLKAVRIETGGKKYDVYPARVPSN